MSDFWTMGGYGAYVWSAYTVFLIALFVDAIGPLLQRRRFLRELAARLKREATRNVSSSSVSRP